MKDRCRFILNAARKERAAAESIDPTGTTPLLNSMLRLLDSQFSLLQGRIVAFFLKTDAPTVNLMFPIGPVYNAGFMSFATSGAALSAFEKWLKRQQAEILTSPQQEDAWDWYVVAGFEKGAGRSYDDVRGTHKPSKSRPSPKPSGSKTSKPRKPTRRTPSSPSGSGKDDFLRLTLTAPVAVEKVQLLAARTFEEVRGLAASQRNEMRKVLADGLVRGQSPRQLVTPLAEQVSISRKRAELVARTEIIRAHAEGQLTALEALGVGTLGVDVEWSITRGKDGKPDKRVCPLCAELAGHVFTIAQARGMLPRHPRCRCAWRPKLAPLLQETVQ